MTTQSTRETDRVAPYVAQLREVAYSLRKMGHPLSAERIEAEATDLHLVAANIDQRVGRL